MWGGLRASCLEAEARAAEAMAAEGRRGGAKGAIRSPCI